MYHIFYFDGLITDGTTAIENARGVYLASARSLEKAQQYVYSVDCGMKLKELKVTGNAAVVIIPEVNIYLRTPVQQAKQVYTIEELRKNKRWKK